jgi:hypothetical protein
MPIIEGESIRLSFSFPAFSFSDRRLAGKENAGKKNKRLYGREISEAVH